MLKPLTFSLSLAVALGLCSVSMAGGDDTSCTTCGLASPQGVVASPQGATYVVVAIPAAPPISFASRCRSCLTSACPSSTARRATSGC